ncbi:CU044_5270 family protein [Paractinoplanes toevensis]|uniref:CU044_5270 family protein n=1 Tax=Paractinoplanes toevensis TaxID=571911 RepID=A0A919W9Q8_9ACTN|nr:CU044_5270 family protein [Actinoplanes toevensis]GIM96219.1 hypothetical protein Ato02nite_080120 [Actinoplanes toevensis]
MDEFDVLTQLRQDTPAMSARARAQGRLRLLGEIEGRRRESRWLPARRTMLAAAGVVILTVAILGYQVVGSPDGGSTAEASTVLQAAAAVAGVPAAVPRAEQFTYVEVVHVTSGGRQRVQEWRSVDGSRPGLIRSSGFLGSTSGAIAPYDPAAGLRTAPYAVLAKLPTDPAALARVLGEDPYVQDSVRYNNVSRDVGIWSLVRELVETAPPAQKAALFQAASTIKGITYVPTATDAAGRTGEAVGLDDPRLGNVQFLFDRDTHAFLGERILNHGSTTSIQFNDAIQQTGVADTAGSVPRR